MTTPRENMEAFLATLDPKVAKNVKTASSIETIRHPLASEGLTRLLNGGISGGRISTFYGNYSSGKSGLIYQSIGQLWQPMGLNVVLVDVEGTYTPEWGARMGIDNDALIVIRSKSSGKIEKEIRPFLENGIDIVVIDSISQIMPEVFVDDKSGALNDQENRKQVGAHAKAITSLINGIHYFNERTAVVLISQTTTFMGQSYVEQVPHGGKKTEFGSSVMVQLSSSNSPGQVINGMVKRGDRLVEEAIGRKVTALVKKNKTGKPFVTCKYDFYFDGPQVGVDRVGEVVDNAIGIGVLIVGGAWTNRPSTGDKWQGRANLVKEMKESPELLESIRKECHTLLTGEIDG